MVPLQWHIHRRDEELNQDEQWKYSGVVVACTMASSKPSETALRGCCKVCAKPEEEDKRFLVCDHSLCMYKYYHIRCMRPGQIANTHQITRRWYCPSCLCRRCFCDVDDSKIVMCDGCDEAYHTYCMRPSRATVPKGDWYCKSCTKARELEQQARELEEKVAQDEEMILKIHRRLNAPLVRSYRYDALNLLAAAAKQREEEDAAEELKRKEAAEKMDVDVATVAE